MTSEELFKLFDEEHYLFFQLIHQEFVAIVNWYYN